MKIAPDAVAVTGIGIVSPLGYDANSLLRGMLESRSCLGPLSLFDAGIETASVAEIRGPLPVETVPGYGTEELPLPDNDFKDEDVSEPWYHSMVLESTYPIAPHVSFEENIDTPQSPTDGLSSSR